MTAFTGFFERLPAFSTLLQAIEKKSPAMAVGLSDVQKAVLLLALHEKSDRPFLIITEDEKTAQRLAEDCNRMAGERIADVFADEELTLRPTESVSAEYEMLRLGALFRVVLEQTRLLFASAVAAGSYTLPPEVFSANRFSLSRGGTYDQAEILNKLQSAGYLRRDQVDGPGQFAVRGGILDVFPVGEALPVRMEFWGDEVNALARFDLDSQRRTEEIEEIAVFPASQWLISQDALAEKIQSVINALKNTKSCATLRQNLERDRKLFASGVFTGSLQRYISCIYETPATVFDYVSDPLVVVCEQESVKQALKTWLRRFREDEKILMEEGLICPALDDYHLLPDALLQKLGTHPLDLETFVRKPTPGSPPPVSFEAVSLGSFRGGLSALLEDVTSYREEGYTVLIAGGTEKAAYALASDLNRQGVTTSMISVSQEPEVGGVYVIPGSLSCGFAFPKARFVVLTHAVTGERRRTKRRARKGEEIHSLSDLSSGDLVVHVQHGIGRFLGIERMTMEGIEKDYIKIQYAGTDVLYVPVTQLDLVSKYIGSRSENKKLNRLGGDEWKRTRRRVKKAVEEMARQLAELYAKRERAAGFAFSPDNDWMRGFEERFAFEETSDQLEAIAQIKKDMERPRPMDRLLCGDVGFGKTEVALRAAFKCVLDGKQCALLCPTTILAMQHYETARVRLGDFPVSLALFTRFTPQKEKKQILKKLETGEIDMVIGTHRIVQKDVRFHDLGLAVIDEEQRFGVLQKERFKELFAAVDVLSLSATPIPRTLNMALSGIRDMSLLEEPPQDRLPVQTYVLEYDQAVAAQAIAKELRRGGQVYYVHNRIDSIYACESRVRKLAPQARIGVAHGQMGERELTGIWQAMTRQELDILVCTTIIETGIDLPNVNTLIIERADCMGLSQLYQLRGRVGRSDRRAYAYFTFDPGRVVNEEARKRLAAIREFTRFGSGYRIALRDMEIRGAGSVLSQKQHGQMEAVGYDLYLKILGAATARLQGKSTQEGMIDCSVDLPVTAHIPESYIPNLSQRLDVYKKISALRTLNDRLDLMDELIDRFGEPPKPVEGLMDVALTRAKAASLGISEISSSGGELRFYPKHFDPGKAAALLSQFGEGASLNAHARGYLSMKLAKQTPSEMLKTLRRLFL